MQAARRTIPSRQAKQDAQTGQTSHPPTPGAPRHALSQARPQRVQARGVPLRYVEGLSDARTMLATGFSILLAIEGFATIAEQIVVARDRFIPRVGWIDLDKIQFFLVSRGAMQNRPLGSDDFAVPNIG